MVERIGLQAIWDNTNFTKGQSEYMKAMTQAQGMTSQTASNMSNFGQSGSAIGNILGSISGALGISTGQLIGLGAALGVAKGAFDLISGAVSSFASFMFQGADSALMVASRVEQLNLIAQTLAQNAGMDSAAVNELVASLNKQGISLSTSNMLVAQFARFQLDMSKATDLARVAQDAATISNEGSSDALDGLLHGIETLNIRILRQHGILVDTDVAYAQYGATINKAGSDLSSTEKQQAMLNAVIAQGANIAGAYQASMLTAGKQIGSLTSRILPDLKAALGAPFQGAFFNVVKGFNDVLEGLREMTVEGGVLYPVLVQLGGFFEMITDPIREFGATLKASGSGGLADFASNIMTYVNNAFNWGVNLVTNFATGMINGAANAITAAINYISGMLSHWFAPGSPPAVAPDIDVWGSEAMDEYLNGFTEADFNILKNIQQPMKNVFGSLSDMGDISAQAAQEMYASFSEEFITAMAQGNVTQQLFDQLAKAGGVYGDELASIAAKQYDLKVASDLLKVAQEGLDEVKKKGAADVKAADEAAETAKKKYDDTVLAGEKAIEAATKKRDKASAAVTKGLQEYNQMLRGGASKEALAAKLKEINANKAIERSANQEILDKTEAAKVAEEAAKAEVDAAEENAKKVKENSDAAVAAEQAKVDAAKASLKLLQDQEAVLEMQLQTMIDINKAQADAWRLAHPTTTTPTPTPTPTAPGGVAPTTPELPTGGGGGGFDPDKITNSIRDAVSKAAADMKAKIIAAWETIKIKIIAAWMIAMAKIKRALKDSGLLEKWEEIKKAATDAWEKIKKEVSDVIFFLKRWWSQYGSDIVSFFTDAWKRIQIVLKFFMPLIKLIIKDLFAGISLIVKVGWALIKGIFKVAMTIIGGLFRFFGKLLKGDWKGAWDAIKDTFDKVWKIIKQTANTIWEAFKKYFEDVLDNLKEFWASTWGKILDKAKEIWDNIKKYISDKIDAVQKYIGDVSDNIKKAWTTFWDAVSKKASDIWDAIKKYISDKIDAVKTYLDTVSTNIKTAWTTFWDIVSKKASDIWDTIKTYISTKIDAVKTYLDTVSTNIKTAWTNFWDAVSLKASNIWDAIKLYISTKIDKVKGYIDTVSTNISTAWTTFWDNIKLKASGIWDDIKLKVSGALDTIKGYFGSAADGTGFIGGLATKWDTFWTNFKNTIVGIWDGENGIKTKVSNAIEAVKGYFTNAAGTGLLDKIGKVATDVWTKFYNIGWNLVDAIKTGVSDAAAALWKGIGGLVGKLIDIIKNLLGMGSPSKVFMDIGNQMMQGMDIGIRAHAILPKNAMMEAMLPITRAAQVPITQGTSNYYQPNITMHNNINNGMSVPYLQALIIRTVKKGMTS